MNYFENPCLKFKSRTRCSDYVSFKKPGIQKVIFISVRNANRNVYFKIRGLIIDYN